MNSQAPSLNTPTSPASDPLAALQDIHLPPEIGLWPPAYGWWLLAFLLVFCCAAVIFFVRRNRQRNAYRVLALIELNTLQQTFSQEQTAEYLQGVSVLLRRTALSGFDRDFNASLKGSEWLEWLDKQCPNVQHQFSQGVGTTLLTGPYQKNPEYDRQQLHDLCVKWIKEHHNQWQQKKSAQQKPEATDV